MRKYHFNYRHTRTRIHIDRERIILNVLPSSFNSFVRNFNLWQKMRKYHFNYRHTRTRIHIDRKYIILNIVLKLPRYSVIYETFPRNKSTKHRFISIVVKHVWKDRRVVKKRIFPFIIYDYMW